MSVAVIVAHEVLIEEGADYPSLLCPFAEGPVNDVPLAKSGRYHFKVRGKHAMDSPNDCLTQRSLQDANCATYF
jgi:hypothetical protein